MPFPAAGAKVWTTLWAGLVHGGVTLSNSAHCPGCSGQTTRSLVGRIPPTPGEIFNVKGTLIGLCSIRPVPDGPGIKDTNNSALGTCCTVQPMHGGGGGTLQNLQPACPPAAVLKPTDARQAPANGHVRIIADFGCAISTPSQDARGIATRNRSVTRLTRHFGFGDPEYTALGQPVPTAVPRRAPGPCPETRLRPPNKMLSYSSPSVLNWARLFQTVGFAWPSNRKRPFEGHKVEEVEGPPNRPPQVRGCHLSRRCA